MSLAWELKAPLLYDSGITIVNVFRSSPADAPPSDVEKREEICEKVRIDENKEHYAIRYSFRIRFSPQWEKKDTDIILLLMNEKGWTIGSEMVIRFEALFDKQNAKGTKVEGIFDTIYRKIRECRCYVETYQEVYDVYFSDKRKTEGASAKDFILRVHTKFEKAKEEISFQSIEDMQSLKAAMEKDGFDVS